MFRIRSEYRRTAIVAAMIGWAVMRGGEAFAQDPDTLIVVDDHWHFTAVPYLWLPSFHGSTRFTVPPNDGPSPDVELLPGGYLNNLKFAAMFTGQAQKGSWLIAGDVVYANAGSIQANVRTLHGPGGAVALPLDTNVSFDNRSTAVDLVGGYEVIRAPWGNIDLLGGARYANIYAEVGWSLSGPLGKVAPSGGAAQTAVIWDGILGVKGQINFGSGSKWYLPYYLDGGAGSANWTWNAYLGVGYRFHWGNIVLAYRNLSYYMDDPGLVEKLQLSGPALGAVFHW